MITDHDRTRGNASRSSGLADRGSRLPQALVAGVRRCHCLGRQSGRGRQGRRRRPGRLAICAMPTGPVHRDSLVLAPGVPLTHPKPHWTVDLARAAGVEIIGDIELFCRERRRLAPGFAVCRDHRHERKIDNDRADRPCAAAQRGATCSLAAISARRSWLWIRRRQSAFMSSSVRHTRSILRRRSIRAIGVLLNISPDHLDRHGTIELYAAIKARLVEKAADCAVCGIDDEVCPGHRVRSWSAPEFAACHHLGAARRRRYRSLCRSSTARRPQYPECARRQGGLRATGACASERYRARAGELFGACPPHADRRPAAPRTSFVNDSKATNADAAEKVARQLRQPSTGSPADLPKEGGIGIAGTALRPHRQGLSDRRGRTVFRRGPGRERYPTRFRARLPMRSVHAARDAGGFRRGRTGGAAGAGRGQFRPVSRTSKNVVKRLLMPSWHWMGLKRVFSDFERVDRRCTHAVTRARLPSGGGLSTVGSSPHFWR